MPGPLPNPDKRPAARLRARTAGTDTPVWSPATPGSLRDAGRALYEAIVSDVAEGYQLDAREQAVLERACRMADLAADLEQSISDRGMWITGSTGQERLSPAVTELRQCQSAVATLLARVELGPSEPKTGALNRRQRNELRDALAGRS